MTTSEVIEWFKKISNFQIQSSNKEVILCPSFTLLSLCKEQIKLYNLPFKLGSQNVSPFNKGAYTGEINASQIGEFAEYVVIGHSERRTNFLENDSILENKTNLSKENNLTPIFCIQGRDTKIPENIEIVAYEPISAIGTGNPDTPENAEEVARYVKDNNGINYVLYGGSVTSKNVSEFTKMPNINGVLVGGASLDAQEFYSIIQNT